MLHCPFQEQLSHQKSNDCLSGSNRRALNVDVYFLSGLAYMLTFIRSEKNCILLQWVGFGDVESARRGEQKYAAAYEPH
ncbi:hypothetical protein CH063_05591 [Colletotrichum higginsianum]|uniref:Uncharacterized protein n=1 Tax=Colletotrichum higginsianum (strain IMI 349063) TaxID=759273 RepID=H1UZI7_COLHI|nr:hypothetical protein CH063_05591 [Colletotrichum higginsianum]